MFGDVTFVLRIHNLALYILSVLGEDKIVAQPLLIFMNPKENIF